MVGVGLLMLLVSWLGAWKLRGDREPPRWLLQALVAMTFVRAGSRPWPAGT